MKRLLACLALAACATPQISSPPERVAGCWIARNSTISTTTMRWLPDRERPGVLLGDKLEYRASGDPISTRYSLEQSDAGHALCALDRANHATACWVVAQGQDGSLEGGRAFIDAYADRLRISIVGDGAERTIFQGRRDGCD
ncbi:MAG TPA: hypothetical protein VM915_14000 [Verrucomicrobiae bacterium]|jgi:hypothetical protein|nr:hypothetical protein [Verrucomicrobiae bacterium]